MEKQNKPKNKILKYLPRAASAMSFRNPMFSPGRDKQRQSTKQNIGFSGPMIPDVARRKPKNMTPSFDVVAHEPTSPKVSCMGQIKLKKKKKDMIKLMMIQKKPKTTGSVCDRARERLHGNDKDKEEKEKEKKEKKEKEKEKEKEKKKNDSKAHKIFSKSKDDEKSSRGHGGNEVGVEVVAPSLGKMKKYTSGRDTLGDFDWTAQIKRADHGGDDLDLDYHSFEVGGRRRSSEEVDEEVIIPHSAPILVGGNGAKTPEQRDRKQINLWQRRTMPSPPPLQL